MRRLAWTTVLVTMILALSASAIEPACAQDVIRLPPVDDYAPPQPAYYVAPTPAYAAPPAPGYYAPPPAPNYYAAPPAPSYQPQPAVGYFPPPQQPSYPQQPYYPEQPAAVTFPAGANFGPPAINPPGYSEAALEIGTQLGPSPGNEQLWADPNDYEGYEFRTLPDGVIWKAFLAGEKESRLGAQIINLKGMGTAFDGTMGGRFALWRYGTDDPFFPEGVEFDIEGSAQVRLLLPEEVDVQAVDFRAGGFFTWGTRWRQTKLGYYHLSSHLGDEFLLKNPGYPRQNYARDVIILAQSWYLTEELRIYAEAGWAFWADVADPWEFQFGFDYAPARPTGPRGAPFLAMNAHLREELNYSGNFTLEAGWAWRGDTSGNMFRAGFYYYNGLSSQYSLYAQFEEQIGFGIWFDR